MSLLNKFRKNRPKKSFEEEIFEHVCDLLNTKQTFGAYQKDLGLDTYYYINSYDGIKKQVSDDIKICLSKYETRIQVVDIESVESSGIFSLSFVIKCKIQNKPHSFQISFNKEKNQFGQESGP